ncbi:MAG: hypothetical protein Q9227_008759 [Pyrenula ochraceoflavens]
MVGKKSGKALLREEGLERTDNNMDLSTWPQINPINQKNYYTDYLKRDDQILAYRLQQDEARNRMAKEAKDRDRALALGKPDGDIEMGEAPELDDAGGELTGQEAAGSKVIVIHIGSQNMRIGLASDALPKTVPMVIAKRSPKSEAKEAEGEPSPKRIKLDDGSDAEPEKMFGDEFASEYTAMSADLKARMRINKRRVMPNSKEMVINYNRRTTPDTISEHNDPLRIDWTELPPKPENAPAYITGKEALRIPDDSRPRYRLYWPIRHGWCNEGDYTSKRHLYGDIALIIAEAVRIQLGIPLRTRSQWSSYGCVFIIPDLYERSFVTDILEMAMKDFGFGRACFFQESLAASFGAGYTQACIVDIGAEKTSICCVEDGMCIEDSRVNFKYGGMDVTYTFIKMLLFDHFPYFEIDLNRRYDFLLAEELKQKFCTLNEAEVSVQTYDFHVRVSGQDTRKFTFKCYDEVLLAPAGFFRPKVFENSDKLGGRRKVVDPSRDLYDSRRNDPRSSAQGDILSTCPAATGPGVPKLSASKEDSGYFGSRPKLASALPALKNRKDLDLNGEASERGTPAPEMNGTPQLAGTPALDSNNVADMDDVPEVLPFEYQDDRLPVFPLDSGILTSISYASNSDERKIRDFLGGIMLIGGGSQIPGLNTYLEERLHALRPNFSKEILIGRPPRELDPQVVTWKGGSVFGKLSVTNDSWMNQMEYDRLGSRLLAYKCMWAW